MDDGLLKRRYQEPGLEAGTLTFYNVRWTRNLTAQKLNLRPDLLFHCSFHQSRLIRRGSPSCSLLHSVHTEIIISNIFIYFLCYSCVERFHHFWILDVGTERKLSFLVAEVEQYLDQ